MHALLFPDFTIHIIIVIVGVLSAVTLFTAC